jgi:hypothetical protein
MGSAVITGFGPVGIPPVDFVESVRLALVEFLPLIPRADGSHLWYVSPDLMNHSAARLVEHDNDDREVHDDRHRYDAENGDEPADDDQWDSL